MKIFLGTAWRKINFLITARAIKKNNLMKYSFKNIFRDKYRPKYCLISVALVICVLGTACNSSKYLIGKAYKKMSIMERALADSIIAHALDHEALYTLVDTLKPMSSVQFYRMPVFSLEKRQRDSALQELAILQRIVNELSVGDFQFVLNPFERTDSIYRNMEIYVFRKSRLQSAITAHADFFNKWGITAIANPASVLAITEYEQKYDRWRSYGYLFGYPDYAVDFFVEAGKSQDSTKAFVKRDFFAIPVYAGEKGHFTYAIPKNHIPGAIDSAIYNKSMYVLSRYKELRKKYTSENGYKAVKLWKKALR
jgi:hypothetical protein